ncbi:MAG: methyltransferase domain-containing protein [Pseudomonadota bacterium]
MNWNPAALDGLRGFGLRPAQDLLARVPAALPPGPIVDLGAGTGQIGAALRARFPGRDLTAVDRSAALLEEAEDSGLYARLALNELDDWTPDAPPALIFSNAALHLLDDHRALMPRLAASLAPAGVLAVQMPRHFDAPSNRLLRDTARALFPDRFAGADAPIPVGRPGFYAALLGGLGRLDLWETKYYKTLDPAPAAHPVRLLASASTSTARPILSRLGERERATLWEAYDAALQEAYPTEPDGRVIYPVRRLFFVLCRDD